MNSPGLIPAALIALSVTAMTAGTQLVPFGQATVLVRVSARAPEAALAAAAATDAALVRIPAPGFAVLRGNASRIRALLGLAVVWQGTAACSSPDP